MAPRKATKKPRAKTTYKRRAPARRAPMDGQNILVNAYFEAKKNLAAGESFISYSICIDPKEPLITKGAGVTVWDGADAPAQLAGDSLSLQKYTTFKDLFNQYRINSATVKVRVDGSCGLENAVITSNDKGVETAIGSMKSALSGAHKSHSMTVSRRELSYGMKCSGQDLDFLSTNTDLVTIPAEKKYIKVFQKLPAGSDQTVCEHQVQVLLNLTLKDSKNLN